MSLEWKYGDSYENIKFPFLEICVMLELQNKINIVAKRKMRRT